MKPRNSETYRSARRNKGKASSMRARRKEALKEATAIRVKAEKSIMKGNNLLGKKVPDWKRKKLFANLPEVHAIAYKKHPDLWRGL